jgi:hypothetical protein
MVREIESAEGKEIREEMYRRKKERKVFPRQFTFHIFFSARAKFISVAPVDNAR